MSIKSIRDLSLRGKRLFLRVDFNVPLDEHRKVSDNTRIRAALPTLEFAQQQGARVILASHLGRPKGQANARYSLKPVAEELAKQLQQDVPFANDCLGSEAEAVTARLQNGQACLLENLRFHKEEEANDAGFSRQLAGLCDVYVNDAFGTAHRAHASTVGMIPFCREAAAGFLMQKELEYLGKLLENPEMPFVAVLGGAKVSDKIEVIQNLIGRVDALLIGGAMAYTFLLAQGLAVGKSLVERDKVNLAHDLMKQAADRKVQFLLPADHVIATKVDAAAETKIVNIADTPPEWMGLDIGPKTIELYREVLKSARTVFWNGPMGVFEMAPFAAGTVAVARALGECRGITVVGGGDSVAAVNQSGVADQITHISTGGGASLEFLSGIKLPGVAALEGK
ncbi:MAG: phosphoglycerate kinase [Acidobacteriia bacterium]|nr:phosphoglycerate kinase [Terriglobia bacterium]